MAVISIASAKGGCGKTTTALLLGTELALDGYSIVVLDCDSNQHASKYAMKASIEGFRVVAAVDEANVLTELRAAETDADVVIIDLPGGSSTLALKALQRSNFVLVPVQPSLLDARDAVRTVQQINDAEELSRIKIARALIWTRVPSSFEARGSRHVRESIESQGYPIFGTQISERSAFREFHINGETPRSYGGNAAANVAAVTAELLRQLEQLSVSA